MTDREKKDKRNKRERAKRAQKRENTMSKEVKETKEVKKNKLPKERYYSYNKTDKVFFNAVNRTTGEPLIKRDNKNIERYNAAGDPIIIQKSKPFTTLNDKMSKGYLCFIEVDPNTEDLQEQELIKRLRYLANEREDVNLWNEETHEKTSNFAAYKEKQEKKGLIDEVADLKAQLAAIEGK